MKLTLTAILVSLLTSIPCIAKDGQFSDILGECWKGHDHPQMSACVQARAAEAHADLAGVVAELRKDISKSEESAAYSRSGALAALEASVKAFQEYRTRQCAAVFTVASMGNGEDDSRLACEAQLDLERTAQLRAILWWYRDDSSPNTSLERTRER